MSRILLATGVIQLDTFIFDVRINMGDIQLGKMSNSVWVPLRTTFILAVMVVCLIWSLLALDMPITSSQVRC